MLDGVKQVIPRCLSLLPFVEFPEPVLDHGDGGRALLIHDVLHHEEPVPVGVYVIGWCTEGAGAFEN